MQKLCPVFKPDNYVVNDGQAVPDRMVQSRRKEASGKNKTV